MTTRTKTPAPTTLFKAWRLTMIEGTAKKFYDVYAGQDGTLVLHWGRIGTAGQHKIESHTASEAENVAMRQVYAKATKGYTLNVDAVEFPLPTASVQNLVNFNSGLGQLESALVRHMASDQFAAKQRLATAHYDTFIESAQKVLDQAAEGRALEDLLDDWNSLAESWGELDAKHGHALAAVRLVQQTVSQKLMGG